MAASLSPSVQLLREVRRAARQRLGGVLAGAALSLGRCPMERETPAMPSLYDVAGSSGAPGAPRGPAASPTHGAPRLGGRRHRSGNPYIASAGSSGSKAGRVASLDGMTAFLSKRATTSVVREPTDEERSPPPRGMRGAVLRPKALHARAPPRMPQLLTALLDGGGVEAALMSPQVAQRLHSKRLEARSQPQPQPQPQPQSRPRPQGGLDRHPRFGSPLSSPASSPLSSPSLSPSHRKAIAAMRSSPASSPLSSPSPSLSPSHRKAASRNLRRSPLALQSPASARFRGGASPPAAGGGDAGSPREARWPQLGPGRKGADKAPRGLHGLHGLFSRGMPGAGGSRNTRGAVRSARYQQAQAEAHGQLAVPGSGGREQARAAGQLSGVGRGAAPGQ